MSLPIHAICPPSASPSVTQPIQALTPTGPVYLPFGSGDGEQYALSVSEGDLVKKGAILTRPLVEGDGFVPVFSSVTGIFEGLTTVAHPVFGELTCCVVRPTDVETSATVSPLTVAELTPEAIVELARDAAIVDEVDGLPLDMKLRNMLAGDSTGLTITVAAFDREPGCTASRAVVEQDSEAVGYGLSLIARCAGAAKTALWVQDPPSKLKDLATRLGGVTIRYAGANYPARPLPADHLVFGAEACRALANAAQHGVAQTDFVVSVIGDAVKEPLNVRVPAGVVIDEVLNFCGVEESAFCAIGGYMTGVEADRSLPIFPTETCLLALRAKPQVANHPCMGCGACVRVCPRHLLPFSIDWFVENMQYEQLPSLHPEDCDGCGCCSFVCPSERPLAARVAEAGGKQGSILITWGDNT